MESGIGGQTKRIYKVDGSTLSSMQRRGLNIVRESDGSVRKVIVR